MAGHTQEMHGKKSTVEEDIGQGKVNFPQCFVHHAAKYFGEPIVQGGKHYKDDAGYHIVKVGHDKIGVVDEDIDRRGGHVNAA